MLIHSGAHRLRTASNSSRMRSALRSENRRSPSSAGTKGGVTLLPHSVARAAADASSAAPRVPSTLAPPSMRHQPRGLAALRQRTDSTQHCSGLPVKLPWCIATIVSIQLFVHVRNKQKKSMRQVKDHQDYLVPGSWRCLGIPIRQQSGTAHPTLKTRVLSVYTTSHTHCLWYLAPRRVPCHVLYPQGRRREQDPIRCGTNLTPPRSYVELLHCCYCCRSCCSCSYCRRCVWLCGCVAVPACVTVCCLR